MPHFTIQDGVQAAIDGFELPDTLGFGVVTAPVMFSATWEGGAWGRRELLPYGPIAIAPGARALHFAEQVFEGMKAYRVGRPNGNGNLFRARDNCARLARSAARLAMPVVPEALFMEGVEAVTATCAPFIPDASGKSLYLRPFILGTEPGYAVRGSTTARFMVIANPTEAYASGPIRVMVERKDVRAAAGGTGAVKTGANYAASLRASGTALANGYTVALWLDPATGEAVEELSGMNLFAVVDGELHTPALNGSILPGITRDSILTLAPTLGFRAVERVMPIADLLADIGTGRCSEVFACGTAAIVAPVAAVGEIGGATHAPAHVDRVAETLREALLAIQERRAPDPFGWVTEVPASASGLRPPGGAAA